jgi:hypothetical protein
MGHYDDIVMIFRNLTQVILLQIELIEMINLTQIKSSIVVMLAFVHATVSAVGEPKFGNGRGLVSTSDVKNGNLLIFIFLVK